MTTLVMLFFAHWVADFALQSSEMAAKKSKELKWLVRHLIDHFFVTLAFCSIFSLFDPGIGLLFATMNTLLHGIIDWFLWKSYRVSVRLREGLNWYGEEDGDILKNYPYYTDKFFWTFLGFDQLLHSACIIVLYFSLL